jgi:hypothetical protein
MVEAEKTPHRIVLGSDAYTAITAKVHQLLIEYESLCAVAHSTDFASQ